MKNDFLNLCFGYLFRSDYARLNAVFFLAVFRSSLKRVSNPCWVTDVCHVRSPRRSANWSNIRRVSFSAFLWHWEISKTFNLSLSQCFGDVFKCVNHVV